MSHFRPNVDAMHGYTPGEQPRAGERVVKLNTNESPYPPSPKVLAALRDIPADALRRYPQPTSEDLRRTAARVWSAYGITPEMVLAGNGSDDLLTIAVRSFAGEGDRVAFPWPTYSLYDTLCQIQAARAVRVPFPADWSLPAGELLATGARLAFIANPNAPSGTALPASVIADFADRFPGVVVVDEAYADFAEPEHTFLRVLAHGGPAGSVRHRNVVVLRTFSKSYALAGARLGLAFADPALISGMVKVKDSYNVDAVAARLGAAALEDQEHLAATVAKVRSERTRLTARLSALGFAVLPSRANFVLARRPGAPAGETAGGLYRALKARGILVRYFDVPELRDALRISVGTPEENDALLAALEELAG
jgi:histidinol-phosphate aminotransferase